MKSLSDLGGRNPGFERRRPDPDQSPTRQSETETAVESILARLARPVLIALVCVVVALPFLIPLALRRAREAHARSLIQAVSGAVARYTSIHGSPPPGDGVGSAALVKVLTSAGTREAPYIAFPPESIDPSGSLISPTGGVFHYRSPAAKGTAGFDLWTSDAAGRPDGINNWTP